MTARRGVLYEGLDRGTEFASGSWLIRCGATSHREELRHHLPGDLLLRQVRRLRPANLLVCQDPATVDNHALRELTELLHLESPRRPLSSPVEAVWDGAALHGLTLEDRLDLISWVDASLRIDGHWISVACDHFGTNPAWGSPLSPEEVVGYFCPAYQVVHQEQLGIGTGPHRMHFSTLVFRKRAAIERAQLDLDVHREIQDVAARRRAHEGLVVPQESNVAVGSPRPVYSRRTHRAKDS